MLNKEPVQKLTRSLGGATYWNFWTSTNAPPLFHKRTALFGHAANMSCFCRMTLETFKLPQVIMDISKVFIIGAGAFKTLQDSIVLPFRLSCIELLGILPCYLHHAQLQRDEIRKEKKVKKKQPSQCLLTSVTFPSLSGIDLTAGNKGAYGFS